MESTNNTWSQQEYHLYLVEDGARHAIDEQIVPCFKKLKEEYPEAKSWDVAIAPCQGTRDFLEVILFANVDPEAGADNPSDKKIHRHTCGDAICDILSAASRILKQEEAKYEIDTSLAPSGDEPASIYIFTKHNK